jgi:hypothetical protein
MMKKMLLNIGKKLTRVEQKQINGGDASCFHTLYDYSDNLICGRNADCFFGITARETFFCNDNGCCQQLY